MSEQSVLTISNVVGWERMVDELYFTNRADWRAWLERHSESEDEVWLVYYKKHSGKHSIPYEDSVEEAICFGWIDGIIRRVDDEMCARKFVPRKSRSRWSESNRARAQKMIDAGKMTDAGIARVEEAKKNGEWFKSHANETDLVVPTFIQRALACNIKARESFSKLAPSYRRLYVRWITDAEREETRLRRLKEAVGLLEQNKKLGLK